jgi:hypothetical protein
MPVSRGGSLFMNLSKSAYFLRSWYHLVGIVPFLFTHSIPHPAPLLSHPSLPHHTRNLHFKPIETHCLTPHLNVKSGHSTGTVLTQDHLHNTAE